MLPKYSIQVGRHASILFFFISSGAGTYTAPLSTPPPRNGVDRMLPRSHVLLFAYYYTRCVAGHCTWSARRGCDAADWFPRRFQPFSIQRHPDRAMGIRPVGILPSLLLPAVRVCM